MVIGILQFELTIDHATSLKDKRRVVSSIKDRLHREHMVAVAETARLDDCRVAQLGLAVVSNSVPQTQSVLDRIVEKLKNARDCVLTDHCTEILTGMKPSKDVA